MVFAGVYPEDSSQYDLLRVALEKLTLNDASISVHPENSAALGAGFRCGFLGVLHLDVVMTRLDQEYKLQVIVSFPVASGGIHERCSRRV